MVRFVKTDVKFMKTLSLIMLVVAGLSVGALQAQNVVIAGALNYSTPAMATVQAAPVAQQPAVVYQASVQPVAYAVPVAAYRAYSPNVIYFGAGCGYPRPNYFSGYGYYYPYGGYGYGGYCYPPPVTYFGYGRGYGPGYYYGHCR
jgi:hypothetical protein